MKKESIYFDSFSNFFILFSFFSFMIGLSFPIINAITHKKKLVNTIEEPTGILSIIQHKNNPIVTATTEDIAANIVTCLNVLKINLADSVGNIINAVINNAPISFIPITTTKDVKIEIVILIIVAFVPVDLENTGSNVAVNILLYKIINTDTTITTIIILIITLVKSRPNIFPYK